MPGAKRRYLMDYIPDKAVFKAVMNARAQISEYGVPPGLAIARSARKQGVSRSEVAKYVGQVAGTVSGRMRKRRGSNEDPIH